MAGLIGVAAYLRHLGNGVFVFDFPQHSNLSWQLSVTSARDALLVCRLHVRWTGWEVAYFLLQHGVRFRTLVRLPRDTIIYPPTSQHHHILPIRLSGYKFTMRDWEAYKSQCLVILSQPRARSALLRGGIIWRIAVEVLSFDDVLRGPSLTTTIQNRGFCVSDQLDSFADDMLTDVEFDLLSGAYICYTGVFRYIRYFFPGLPVLHQGLRIKQRSNRGSLWHQHGSNWTQG